MAKEANLDCIFCKIILGELPSEIIASNQDAVAIRDMYPQAPVHILVVPRQHTKNIGEL
ncbi:MAG: HIT domain-containing protein, partial [Micrococcales bacterium]|nr:HIT domain-containing protein [Micrococcales bacterium]